MMKVAMKSPRVCLVTTGHPSTNPRLVKEADALSEASGAVAKNAKKGYSEARDFSETVAEAIGHAFSKKAGDWLEKIS